MKTTSKVYTAIILVFLLAPIAILLVFSFNDSKSLSVFSGFSLRWYRELFQDEATLRSVKNTVVLAVSAMAISTVMGTAAAVGMHRLRGRWMKRAFDTVTDLPMTNPDIITGISLMLMFVFAGRLF
ncbi:MAG: ABC transporter permease, partial [Oscillospiraceae bacterium]|nr:ABC transporter permease [Oscillospiraceae bacterium]